MITQSSIIEDSIQIDGRRQIRERHVDHLGQPYDYSWMAEAGQDVEAVLPARAAQIEADLAAAEIAANLAEIEGGE